MIIGAVFLSVLTLPLAALLLWGQRLLAPDSDGAVDRVERLLPRIQCGQCGYEGCRPYAEALVAGTAAINLCPPGGEATVRALAAVLGAEPQSIPPGQGHASMDRVARIDESLCIGCNRCSEACPVDAILGVPQMMHTIIADDCTGCERCLAPCPVDCIEMVSRRA